MNAVEVWVIGRSCLDHIAVVPAFPAEDSKTAAVYRTTEAGGQGGTSACCIARLGGRVAYAGRLGDDPEGRFCRQRLRDFGVDTRWVEAVPGGKTPVAYILVTGGSGRRTIVYEPSRLPPVDPDRLLAAADFSMRTVLLDPEGTDLVRPLRNRLPAGVDILYDAERWRTGIRDAMAAADFFIPSESFLDAAELNLESAGRLERIQRLRAQVRGNLVVTAGGEGAFYFQGDRLYQVPAPAVTVKDTIGAGDNFHGAFALAVARRFAVADAVRFAVAAASLSCRAYGGKNGLPTVAEAADLARRLENRPANAAAAGRRTADRN